jgi:hypothetical protein
MAGARGLGRGITGAVLHEGASVVICDIRYTELDAGHMAVPEAPAASAALVRDFLLGLRR